jgi:hypothetical protein
VRHHAASPINAVLTARSIFLKLQIRIIPNSAKLQFESSFMEWSNLNILILIVVKCRGLQNARVEGQFYAKNLFDGGDVELMGCAMWN